MHKKTKGKGQIVSEVIREDVRDDRIYQLVRFSLPDVSSRKRTLIIHDFLNQANAIGLMEWWTGGSIVKKPRRDFQAVLVLRAR
jgi:hypothetical protein